MNPYFCCFVIAAVLLAPLTVAVDVELGRRTRYRLRLLAAGMLMRRQYLRVLFSRRRVLVEEKGLFTEKSEERELSLPTVHPALVKALLSPKLWRCLLRGVRLRQLIARIAFRNAARTAIVYALMASVVRALNQAGRIPQSSHIALQADFSGDSTRLNASGIISVRLGRLLLAAATAGVLILRALAAEQVKERDYAASH